MCNDFCFFRSFKKKKKSKKKEFFFTNKRFVIFFFPNYLQFQINFIIFCQFRLTIINFF